MIWKAFGGARLGHLQGQPDLRAKEPKEKWQMWALHARVHRVKDAYSLPTVLGYCGAEEATVGKEQAKANPLDELKLLLLNSTKKLL